MAEHLRGGLALSTVKRHARADRPERLQRAQQYRSTLAGPYRDHLRKRRAEDPAIPVLQLLREIRELGYPGQPDPARPVHRPGPGLSPRRAARLLLTRPTSLTADQRETPADLAAACPEMTALASLVRSFAILLG